MQEERLRARGTRAALSVDVAFLCGSRSGSQAIVSAIVAGAEHTGLGLVKLLARLFGEERRGRAQHPHAPCSDAARMFSSSIRAAFLLTCCSVAVLLMLAAPARAQRVRLPDPLMLEHALQMAVMHRREVDAADARAAAASERPAIVSAPDDPMVTASIDHFPVEQLMGVDWTIMVQQTFPLGDVLGSRARGAQAEARRLLRDADRVARDVQAEAAMAFLELYLARALDGIVTEQIMVTEQLVAASHLKPGHGLPLRRRPCRDRASCCSPP